MLSVSGMRGTFGGSLTPEVVVRYCGAFAAFVRGRTAGEGGKGTKKKPHAPRVVIGYDGRRGSDAVASLVSNALEMHGCFTVTLFGPVMTPTLGFVVDRLDADAGIQVTASHNPQEWCGLKPIVREVKAKAGAVSASAPDKGTADAIIAMYREGTAKAAAWNGVGGGSVFGHVAEEHAPHVVGLMKQAGALKAITKARFRVAVDSVTRSGFETAAQMLEALKVKVECVNDITKLNAGLFPHTPEPTRDNLVGLSRFVKKAKGKIHAGFAQDPDGDRLAVVDELGNYIGEEYTLALAALAMGELGLLRKGQVIPVNLSTSRMIEDVAATFGCRVVRTAVGEANVVQRMKAEKSPLGGEGNGGVIWPKVTYIRDSLGAMALVLALMAKRGEPLSRIAASIPAYAIVKRKVDLAAQADAARAVEALAAAHAARKPDRTDGVWINFTDERAWLHVRASNTEPIMRLIAEAPTAAMAEAILDEAGRVVGGKR